MPIYRVDNFSGGLVDLPYEADSSSSEILHNLLIDDNGKLVRRGGARYFLKGVAPQIPVNQTVEYIFTVRQPFATSPDYEDVFVSTRGTNYDDSTDAKLYVSRKGAGTADNEYYASWAEVTNATFQSIGSGVNKVCKINDLVILTLNNGRCVCLAYVGGRWKILPTSLPSPTGGTPATETGGAEIRSFALVRRYQFTTDLGTTYLIESEPRFNGPVTTVGILDIDPGLSQENSAYKWTSVPALVDVTHKYHYDISNTVIQPYATEDGGNSLLKCIVSYAEGTATIHAVVETVNGLGVVTGMGEEIYTDSGAAFNSSLTKVAEVIKTSNDVFWAISKELNRALVRSSKPASPFAWPEEFELQIEEPAFGLAAAGVYPILFTYNGVYRIEGFLDATGFGTITKKVISTAVNPISSMSIIVVDGVVYFQARDGFYATEGFKIKKLSDKFDVKYRNWMFDYDSGNYQIREYRAAYDANNGRIYWINTDSSSLTDPFGTARPCFVLNIRDGSMSFSTVNWPVSPTAACGSPKGLVFAGNLGYVYLQTEGQEDNGFNRSSQVTYDTDGSNPAYIPYKYRSTPVSLGSEQTTKWVTSIIVVFEKLMSNLSCKIVSYNDYKDDPRELKAIRERDTVLSKGLRYLRRMFPAGTIRCQSKQIEITNAKVVLYSSGNGGYALGNANGTSNTLQLVSTPTSFPYTDNATSPIRQWLVTSVDNFTTEYLITAASADTLTVSDPGATFPTQNGVSWRVVGYPRDEKVKLMAYTVEYQPFGGGGDAFRQSTTGEN